METNFHEWKPEKMNAKKEMLRKVYYACNLGSLILIYGVNTASRGVVLSLSLPSSSLPGIPDSCPCADRPGVKEVL